MQTPAFPEHTWDQPPTLYCSLLAVSVFYWEEKTELLLCIIMSSPTLQHKYDNGCNQRFEKFQSSDQRINNKVPAETWAEYKVCWIIKRETDCRYIIDTCCCYFSCKCCLRWDEDVVLMVANINLNLTNWQWNDLVRCEENHRRHFSGRSRSIKQLVSSDGVSVAGKLFNTVLQ